MFFASSRAIAFGALLAGVGALLAGAALACGTRTGLPSIDPALAADGGSAGDGGDTGDGGASSAGGADPCDRDADGHAALDCGGPDCDDTDADRHPGAPDTNAIIGGWVAEAISPGSMQLGGWPPAVAVDRSSAVHLAFVEQGLEVAHNRAGGWTRSVVDPQASGVPSLAVSTTGSTSVAYRAPGGVYLATGTAGAWSTQLVDALGDGDPSLALGDDGSVHLAYSAADALRHATNAGSGWSATTLDEPIEQPPSLALDAAGEPHIVYAARGAGELRHATRIGGAWRVDVIIGDGVYGSSSIVIGPASAAHVSYSDYLVDGGGVFHASDGEAGWTSEPINAVASFRSSIAADDRGRLHIVHDDVGQLLYAAQLGGAWLQEPLLFGWNGGTIAVESSGAAHVGYSEFLFAPGNFIGHATNRSLEPDGIDQNCDGVDGVDTDGDGHASLPTGGDDCDDFTVGRGCD